MYNIALVNLAHITCKLYLTSKLNKIQNIKALKIVRNVTNVNKKMQKNKTITNQNSAVFVRLLTKTIKAHQKR